MATAKLCDECDRRIEGEYFSVDREYTTSFGGISIQSLSEVWPRDLHPECLATFAQKIGRDR